MDALSSALAVLTAMITPAVLISACGTLILSTSTRLGRVVDRVRAISKDFEELSSNAPHVELFDERRAMIFHQLDLLTSRARLLQRCMKIFYLALCVFVSTSVAIGMVAAVDIARYSWVPVLMGLLGAVCLFYGSILLIIEARLAHRGISTEMDFLWRLGKHLAPADLVEGHRPHRVVRRLPHD